MSATCTRHFRMHKRGEKKRKRKACGMWKPVGVKPAAPPLSSCCCRPVLSAGRQYFMSAPKMGFLPGRSSGGPSSQAGKQLQHLSSVEGRRTKTCRLSCSVCAHSWNKQAAQSNFEATWTPEQRLVDRNVALKWTSSDLLTKSSGTSRHQIQHNTNTNFLSTYLIDLIVAV